MRWGAVMIGMAWAAARAASGDLPVVATLTVAIFLAMYRTLRPLRLGDNSQAQIGFSLIDVALLAAATGFSDGLASPFVGSVLVAVAVVSFGWGLRYGLSAALTALVSATVVGSLIDGELLRAGALGVLAILGAAVFPGVAQYRLLHMEDRRLRMRDDLARLSDTNQLLGVLNDLARTLPTSLDITDVISSTREQLIEAFDADRMLLLTVEDGLWSPQIQDGFEIAPMIAASELPPMMQRASMEASVISIPDLSEETPRSGSGLYGRLTVNGQDAGLVAVEKNEPNGYSSHHVDLLNGMTDVLALTVANARAFGRLRSLAAAEERTRIARDLHDRLGQWLTYIAMELERINSHQEEPSPELKQLHGDTQGAISELRDTLIELRASVSPERPLPVLLHEVVDRFAKRSTIEVTLVVPEDRTVHLGAVMENELLRIAQEALTNVEKHSMASHAHVSWTVDNGRGVLVIQDDGRGFDPGKGIRGTAYGLVGMRERAASAGAILEVTSEPDQGTVITVLTSQTPREVNQ